MECHKAVRPGRKVWWMLWGVMVLCGCRQPVHGQSNVVWIPPQHDRASNHLGIVLQRAESWPAGNALFQRTQGWTGADGVHSVALGSSRIFWSFGDTWIGSVRDGKRTNATLVNNSVAIQRGQKPSDMQFFVGRKVDGKPDAMILPADGRGWFWMQAGVVVQGRLVVFLTQVIKTTDPGVFGFRVVGRWIGVIANPLDDPKVWRVQQYRLPHTLFSLQREVTFGAAVVQHDSYLYIYGTDEDIKAKSRERYLVLARVPADNILDFSTWQFLSKTGWQSKFQEATRLVSDMASEFSVTPLPRHNLYALVYTERGLSARILARFGRTPWGPWSATAEIYRCPEVAWDRRIFCYNGKAHHLLAQGDELVVNYVTNSFDFWHIATDARLYWPRFVRIRLQYNTKP